MPRLGAKDQVKFHHPEGLAPRHFLRKSEIYRPNETSLTQPRIHGPPVNFPIQSPAGFGSYGTFFRIYYYRFDHWGKKEYEDIRVAGRWTSHAHSKISATG